MIVKSGRARRRSGEFDVGEVGGVGYKEAFAVGVVDLELQEPGTDVEDDLEDVSFALVGVVLVGVVLVGVVLVGAEGLPDEELLEPLTGTAILNGIPVEVAPLGDQVEEGGVLVEGGA